MQFIPRKRSPFREGSSASTRTSVIPISQHGSVPAPKAAARVRIPEDMPSTGRSKTGSHENLPGCPANLVSLSAVPQGDHVHGINLWGADGGVVTGGERHPGTLEEVVRWEQRTRRESEPVPGSRGREPGSLRHQPCPFDPQNTVVVAVGPWASSIAILWAKKGASMTNVSNSPPSPVRVVYG